MFSAAEEGRRRRRLIRSQPTAGLQSELPELRLPPLFAGAVNVRIWRDCAHWPAPRLRSTGSPVTLSAETLGDALSLYYIRLLVLSAAAAEGGMGEKPCLTGTVATSSVRSLLSTA
ncbi:hypothetical protein BQ8482_160044 [Mesorhizobium delmotii]|uniref:Uncharacterized protein n=1 Tax=Mesorhizobium delmotii TaxID=1631247 RepID=A0A2P9AHI1_9HYPH|nr:hypothetical protein BQ8482_160044 [Mesorhizobium delmotii]